jgi:molecular chaperone IbpA
MAMRSFDLSPLFRSSVGYDGMARMLNNMTQEPAPSYPPYNIERLNEDGYRITMAVAGFSENDLNIEVKENQLTISGKVVKDEDESKDRQYLHRGIAERAFERRFSLADHVKVTGADLENGLLHIDIVREVPEAKKPRTIPVNRSSNKLVEAKVA